MDLRKAIVKTIGAISGGWTVAAAHLGMTENALRNRVYEAKGQTLSTTDKLTLQDLAGQTYIIEALAAASGGTFTKLPELGELDNDSIQLKFNQVNALLGEHFRAYMKAIDDNKIDAHERRELRDRVVELHHTIAQLEALIFMVHTEEGNALEVRRG